MTYYIKGVIQMIVGFSKETKEDSAMLFKCWDKRPVNAKFCIWWKYPLGVFCFFKWEEVRKFVVSRPAPWEMLKENDTREKFGFLRLEKDNRNGR